MKRTMTVLFGIGVVVLAASGCGRGPGSPTSDLPSDLPDEVVDAAKETLNARTEIAVEDVEVVEAEQREWSDACLGLADEGEMCAQVITPGWEITLRGKGETYVLRTDEEGATVRMEE